MRTIHYPGELENIKQETACLKVDTMGLAEVRWLDSGKVVSDDYTLIYAGHKEREQAWSKAAALQTCY